MNHLHNQEKEQFKKLFEQEAVDYFENRFNVLETFLQTENHVTSRELQEMLSEKGHQLDLEFVENTLDLMCGFGFAQASHFDNGLIRYEHRHLGHHHDHMICTKCRRIVEFNNDMLENLQARIAKEHGFHMLQHKMEIYGICNDCFKERTDLIPLVLAKQGERVTIKSFTGGAGSRMRLMSMGLRKGDCVEVVTNLGQGHMVIALEFNRYVIGKGLAQKILVQPE